jgi:hypothetical protein
MPVLSNPDNAFAALDSAMPLTGSRWAHPGAHHAEAGYLDPSLGWVGVRAELSGGSLHASIVPGSAQAADVLGAHLPALHAYIAQKHGDSSTVGMTLEERGNAGSGGSQEAPQHDQQSATPNHAAATLARPQATIAAASQSAATSASTGVPPRAGGGRYISVLA